MQKSAPKQKLSIAEVIEHFYNYAKALKADEESKSLGQDPRYKKVPPKPRYKKPGRKKSFKNDGCLPDTNARLSKFKQQASPPSALPLKDSQPAIVDTSLDVSLDVSSFGIPWGCQTKKLKQSTHVLWTLH